MKPYVYQRSELIPFLDGLTGAFEQYKNITLKARLFPLFAIQATSELSVALEGIAEKDKGGWQFFLCTYHKLNMWPLFVGF